MNPLVLRNPHSILAALRARSSDVLTIHPPSGKPGVAWEEVLKLGSGKVRSQSHPGGGRSRPSGPKESREGAGEAAVQPKAEVSIEELFAPASKPGAIGLWLALDCLQDPHNVGAIFRAAAFFGVNGILMTEERAAGLTGTVYDVAAGGVEAVPYAVPKNLSRALDQAKEAGLWTLGTSEHRGDDFRRLQADRAWILVVGNEERGVRRLTEEKCDQMCRIQSSSSTGVTSLNVAVATGILISHFTSPLVS